MIPFFITDILYYIYTIIYYIYYRYTIILNVIVDQLIKNSQFRKSRSHNTAEGDFEWNYRSGACNRAWKIEYF